MVRTPLSLYEAGVNAAHVTTVDVITGGKAIMTIMTYKDL
jgi:hypothetical protein